MKAEMKVPGRVAVLVIDVQRALFMANPPPFEAEAVLAALQVTLARARAAGAWVVYLQHDGSEEDGVAPFTPGWELHPALEVTPEDCVIRKTVCDAFFGTTLEQNLRRNRIETLVLTGYATDFCVDATLQNAVSRGFQVIVVADGHTTHDNPHLSAREVRQQYNWVWTNSTAPKPIAVIRSENLRF